MRSFKYVVAAGAVALGASIPVAAVAQTYPIPQTTGGTTGTTGARPQVTTPTTAAPQVQGTKVTQPAPKPVEVKPQVIPKSASLPFTGADVLGLTVIGAGAVGTGAVLVRRGRRRATA